MTAILTHHAYGKARVRLSKVTRHADRHDFKELTVGIQLEGDFADSYTRGDNRQVIATDSMKNLVYILAKDHPFTDVESFGQTLAGHFLEHYAHVASATIELEEQPWQRLVVDGREHPHAFTGAGPERRTATVTRTRQEVRVESGLDGLLLLKTTDSAFRGFLRDQYTTLPETDDRIFATMLTARWSYDEMPADWNRRYELVRGALVEIFAAHKSLSVQQTLYAMGEAALAACRDVREITLMMPNRHHLLANVRPFGIENRNEVFVPTDEPHGLITGTLRRAD